MRAEQKSQLLKNALDLATLALFIRYSTVTTAQVQHLHGHINFMEDSTELEPDFINCVNFAKVFSVHDDLMYCLEGGRVVGVGVVYLKEHWEGQCISEICVHQAQVKVVFALQILENFNFEFGWKFVQRKLTKND